jgi:serine/threonine protein kinase
MMRSFLYSYAPVVLFVGASSVPLIAACKFPLKTLSIALNAHTQVAVKRLRTLDFDAKYGSIRGSGGNSGIPPSQAAFKQFFEREIAILASIRHPNVVNFIGASHRPPNRCLVTEYCARGSLDQLLHKSGRPRQASSYRSW